MDGKASLINLDLIVAGRNDREVFREAEIRELAESIETVGLLQPITVRPVGDGYEIVAGERRFRAHRLLGRAFIPAQVRDLTDEQASQIMLLENTQRADLNPIEEARAYRRRVDTFGLSIPEVALWANVNAERVKSRLDLLNLRDDAQALVASGQLSMSHGRVMSVLDSNRQGLALRFINESKRMPTLPEFRSFCGDLLVQQSQDGLFDADAFLSIQVLGDEDAVSYVSISVDPLLPKLRRRANFTATMVGYLDDLKEGGYDEAALTVGTVIAGLMATGHMGGKVRARETA